MPIARSILVLSIVCLMPSAVTGETFSIPLPDLVGEIDFSPLEGKEVRIDFRQQFSEIEGVWIEIEAEVFAQEYEVCGTVYDPQPCVRVVDLLGLWVHIDDGNFPPTGLAYSQGLSFGDDPSASEGYGVDTQPLTPFAYGWDFLLSGQADLRLYWHNNYGDPDRIIRDLIEPTGEVFDAWLTIEGTPVPEPAIALLNGAALLVLIGLRSGATGQRGRSSAYSGGR